MYIAHAHGYDFIYLDVKQDRVYHRFFEGDDWIDFKIALLNYKSIFLVGGPCLLVEVDKTHPLLADKRDFPRKLILGLHKTVKNDDSIKTYYITVKMKKDTPLGYKLVRKLLTYLGWEFVPNGFFETLFTQNTLRRYKITSRRTIVIVRIAYLLARWRFDRAYINPFCTFEEECRL